MKIRLERVHYMPKDLEPGVLYYAEEFGAAAHLCACGCGSKIRTPIAPTEWAIEEGPRGVSLCPSVGNWQQPCRSHYWIENGSIRWSGSWSEEEILRGRAQEERRRAEYFERRSQIGRKKAWLRGAWRQLMAKIFRHR